MSPFMPTVTLSPDALVRIEGAEVVTWAECERRLLAARTPAPEGEVVCSGCEGHPVFPNVPCAVCGASPVVPAPEGEAWRTVPVEPTEAMLEAGCRVLDGSTLELPDFYIAAKVYAAALAAAPPVDGWQPIETAPRDGTPVIGYWWHSDGGSFGVVVWDGDNWRENSDTVDAPTHWMPLPQRPNNEIAHD